MDSNALLKNPWVVGLLIAAICLILTVVVSKTLLKWLLNVLEKYAKRTRNTWDDIVLASLERPVHLLIYYIGFYVAYQMLPIADAWRVSIDVYFRAAAVALAGFTIYQLEAVYMHVFVNFGRRLTHQNSNVLRLFILRMMRAIIVVLTIVIIFDVFSINVSAIVAGFGITSLAVALAAQDTLSNFIAGATLIFDKPFEVGDRIVTGGIDGMVEEISFRTTRLKTLTQEYVTIPNKNIANNAIVNVTRVDHRRCSFSINCTYQSTRGSLKRFVEGVQGYLVSRDDIDSESITVGIAQLAASSIDVEVIYVTKSGDWQDYVRIRQAVIIDIISLAEDHGVDFAYPSRSLYIEKNTGGLCDD